MRSSSDVSLEAELKSGKYGVVRSLLRVLEGGTASKALLDTVIDACKYEALLLILVSTCHLRVCWAASLSQDLHS